MSERSSPTSPTPSAFFDPESWCWRMSQGSLLSAVPESLERLPAWGTTSGGVLYEQQTPERLTAARDGSASLPTPQAWDSARGPDLARANRPDSGGMDLVTVTERLLPTPTVNDSHNQNAPPSQLNRNSLALPALMKVLPTPQARDWKDTGKNTNHAKHALTQPALPRIIALLPTPQAMDSKVFGPRVDWKKRAENHSDSVASVLMNLPSADGSNSSDDEHQTPQTTEGSDPDSSNG